MISMAASSRIVDPVDAKRRWVFKTPQNDIMMSLAMRLIALALPAQLGIAAALRHLAQVPRVRANPSRASG